MTEDAGAAPEAAAPPIHCLRWAVKSSFLGYVARMPDGRAYLGRGAAVNDRNELLFPLDADAAAEPGLKFAFGGDVRFSGHYGLLFVQIAEPRVYLREGAAELTVVDPESKEPQRLRLATFTLTGPETADGLDHWHATDVRLAPESVDLFGGSYQPGEPLEELTITVPHQD
ncbi:HtaA domain-containing protein [Amycolatopsis sp. PS_44_ISF1]|uniref:HtaA domain-containing protein n=1 Tax=Amycolatopsis sp. PS_44_ISF1 TaxID=2974917 RepID=UPI0028DD91E7|nr:HtaA domain-containing protein [Amycolatopsis sp. PS_44_ISF1]MDT8911926.1 HtaA domain-containing protein [Amycolatopsis sp. PS_44_ISF1]